MTSRTETRASALVAAFLYATTGIVTAVLARSAGTPQMRQSWRLAAWLICVAVFTGHFLILRYRARCSTKEVALRTAAGVALGALLLAAAGPVRAHWGTADLWRVSLLSLIVWPILLGVPAYLGAFVAGALINRTADVHRNPPRS